LGEAKPVQVGSAKGWQGEISFRTLYGVLFDGSNQEWIATDGSKK
jgi:hypothetical protein